MSQTGFGRLVVVSIIAGSASFVPAMSFANDTASGAGLSRGLEITAHEGGHQVTIKAGGLLIHDGPSCGVKGVLRLRDRQQGDALAAPLLVSQAAATGKRLLLTGARCDPDGVVSAVRVQVAAPAQPDPVPCSLPYVRTSAVACTN